MYEVLLIVFLIVAISLIILIMLQPGKGADPRISLGSNASTSLFGINGSINFITRITALFATLFFVCSLILGNFNRNKSLKISKWETLNSPIQHQSQNKLNIQGNDVPQ
ncbi:preprotein translocase subunit SecG [Pantoea sp. Aalb]|uniref:preprotein translocase subunit SecG n=1 Tax=Pantoea sp. Aalb TaxID=2576762 RepID=UPI0013293BAC|nr:preprotein translocase subunit SecG [Pantoea sp. Aalb]MXP67833.1 preprotein translocase subunit SecG [Pantoea sp. Aalb]